MTEVKVNALGLSLVIVRSKILSTWPSLDFAFQLGTLSW